MIDLELKATIEFMVSKDYKKRFQGEYLQTFIRASRLKDMLDNWNNLKFEPICPKDVYERQFNIMVEYLEILERRAKIEGISLDFFYEIRS